jgi:hypothetical protein
MPAGGAFGMSFLSAKTSLFWSIYGARSGAEMTLWGTVKDQNPIRPTIVGS